MGFAQIDLQANRKACKNLKFRSPSSPYQAVFILSGSVVAGLGVTVHWENVFTAHITIADGVKMVNNEKHTSVVIILRKRFWRLSCPGVNGLR
jgi:hypothetical protein